MKYLQPRPPPCKVVIVNDGNLFLPAKKPAIQAGNSDNLNNLINNCGQIIAFKGGKFNG